MEKPADFKLLPATDRPTAALSGDWTTAQLGAKAGELAQALKGFNGIAFDLTFEAMRQAFVESRGFMMIELWHPIHRGLWPDPRFKQILVDLGLAAYWRLSGEWGDFARPLGGADFELVG